MIPYNCPGCGLTFNLPDDRAGKVAKCRCGMKGTVVEPVWETSQPPNLPKPEPETSLTVVRPKNALELCAAEAAFLFIAVIVLLSAAAVWVVVDVRREREPPTDHDKTIASVQIAPLVRLADICETHMNGGTGSLAFEAELRQFAGSRPHGNFERNLAEAGIARLATVRSVIVAKFLYEAADERAGEVAREYEAAVARRKADAPKKK